MYTRLSSLVAIAFVATAAIVAACGDASDPTGLTGRGNTRVDVPATEPSPGGSDIQGGGSGPGSSGAPGAGPGAAPAGAGIPCDIAAMLATKCLACHNDPPTAGSLSPLVTINHLLAPAKTDPTKNEAQVSLARMKNAASPMPPASFGNAATAAEIAKFEAWVNGNYQGSCTDGGAPPPPANATCTSCHGDANRTAIAGADANLKSAPPRGTKGETAATTRAVGAHLSHVNTADMRATPIACSECHVVPTATNHSNGKVDMAFGTLARTGNAAPAWNGTTCTASYCHGNFPGGNAAAAPNWTTDTMTCTSCHGAPPATGDHLRGNHQFACSGCHGTGYSANAVNKTLHINGVKNAGGAGSSITTWNPATKSCTPTCHGTETW